jgi:hypothetical protein
MHLSFFMLLQKLRHVMLMLHVKKNWVSKNEQDSTTCIYYCVYYRRKKWTKTKSSLRNEK